MASTDSYLRLAMNVYFNKAETEFLKEKPKGWLRGIVQREMNPEPAAAPGKRLSSLVGSRNPKVCQTCGVHLRYPGQPHGCLG